MTLRRSASIILGATLTGLLVGVILSGDDLVSVEIWIGAAAVVVVSVTVRDLLAAAAPDRAAMRPAWARTGDQEALFQPRGVLNMRSLVMSAQSNPRVHNRRLREHLIELAEHYFPRRHGLDPGHDTDRVSTLLGETGWLIDPAVEDRAPTSEDLDRFLDILLGDDDVAGSAAPQGGAPAP